MMIMYKLTQIYPHNAGYPSIPALSASNVLPLENGEVAWLQTWTCVQGNFLPHAFANHLFLFSHTLSQLGFHVRRLPLQPSALHVLMPPEQLLTPLVRPRLGEESDTLSADLVGKLHEACKFMISKYTWSQTYWWLLLHLPTKSSCCTLRTSNCCCVSGVGTWFGYNALISIWWSCSVCFNQCPLARHQYIPELVVIVEIAGAWQNRNIQPPRIFTSTNSTTWSRAKNKCCVVYASPGAQADTNMWHVLHWSKVQQVTTTPTAMGSEGQTLFFSWKPTEKLIKLLKHSLCSEHWDLRLSKHKSVRDLDLTVHVNFALSSWFLPLAN